MADLTPVVQALWFFVPAYVANPAAVLFGGGPPMDFGRRWRDGRRVFGDGKTWTGFFGGIAAGLFLGLLQWGGALVAGVDVFSFGPFPANLLVLVLLPAGALLGDLAGSFIKRRRGLAKGARAPGLDQYDFVAGAFVLLLIFRADWFLAHYIEGLALLGLAAVLLLTPLLHRAVNIVGFRMGKKEVPW